MVVKKLSDKIDLLVQSLGVERCHRNHLVADYTDNHLGGIADVVYMTTTENELVKALNLASELSLPYLIIGTGTSIMVPEKGFHGLVIKNRISNIKIVGFKGNISRGGIGLEMANVEVASGVTANQLDEFLAENKLQPVGGWGNVGGSIGGSFAYTDSLKKLVEKVKVWEQRDVFDIEVFEYQKTKQVILSLTIKVKAWQSETI